MSDKPIGLNVRKVTNNDPPRVVPSDLASVGLVIRSQRGPYNTPIRVTTPTEAILRFGDPNHLIGTDALYGVYNAIRLFENAKPYGVNLWLSRANEGGTVAASSNPVMDGAQVTSKDGAQFWITVAIAGSVVTFTVEDDDTVPTVTEVYTHTITTLDALWEDVITNSVLIDVAYATSKTAGINVLAQTGSAIVNTLHTLTLVSTTAATYGVKAAQRGVEDPGVWANEYSFEFTAPATAPSTRNLTIYKSVKGTDVQVGVQLTGLTEDDWLDRINDSTQGSDFILVTTTGAKTSLPNPQKLSLTGGVDGATYVEADSIGTSTAGTGIFAFSATNIKTLAYTEVFTPTGAIALDGFLRSSMPFTSGVMNTTKISTVSGVEAYADAAGLGWKNVLTTWSKVATFKGWETVNAENGRKGKVEVPTVGAIIGAGYLRKMFNATGLPSISVAGQGAEFVGTYGLDVDTYNATDLAYLVGTLGINPVMNISGVGYLARTSRTHSTDPLEYDIHKLRSENYIVDSFQSSLGWIEQLPHVPATRAKFVGAMNFFLNDLYNRGMFNQENGYEAAVQIKCDAENNPPAVVTARNLIASVGILYVDIIETAYVDVNRLSGLLTVAKA